MVNNKAGWILTGMAALVTTTLAGVGWHRVSSELRSDELMPITALLKEDQELLQALQSDSAPEKASGILASYLARIRADGVAKHADMKQRLDRLAENNAAIVALINVYLPHAKTRAFSSESQHFLRYAIAWRDRWNSAMELFMAGGNYAVAEVPFPEGLAGAVDAEMSKVAKVDWSL